MESVKAASEVYAPIDGTVIEVRLLTLRWLLCIPTVSVRNGHNGCCLTMLYFLENANTHACMHRSTAAWMTSRNWSISHLNQTVRSALTYAILTLYRGVVRTYTPRLSTPFLLCLASATIHHIHHVGHLTTSSIGWMVKMRISNPDQLAAFMSGTDYKAFLETSD